MRVRSLCLALAICPVFAASAKLGVEKVADQFERPIWVGQAPGVSDKLWVIEQVGKVWEIDAKTGKRADTPVLDIVSDVSRAGNEEGLLGLAFAPDFEKSGRFYVNYTDRSPKKAQTKIVRFTAKKGETTVDPQTAEEILSFEQPYRNHNGGWLDFGPDGMLYISAGDGGAGDDPQGNAQNLRSLLGKILRIDVSGAKGYKVPSDNPFLKTVDAKPEIWAWGVRNAWRCSFDRKTGDFWMGDVGQNIWEEINFMPKGEGSGANYGWRLREGLVPTATKGVGGEAPAGAIEPVHVYKHGGGKNEGLSVTGGYVYRGPVKELEGRYVFGDYQNPRIWSFVIKDGKAADLTDLTDSLQPEGGRINLIASFGEDNQGNLYIVDHQGVIYRITDS
jgi:glucose/arabinose dehydrogenase